APVLVRRMRDRRAAPLRFLRGGVLESARLHGDHFSPSIRVCRQSERVSRLRAALFRARSRRSTKTNCPCVEIPGPVRDCSWAQSFPHCLRNSETLKPLALAFCSSLRYSASDILSSTRFVRGLPVFSGRPMRFFFTPAPLR